MCSKVPNTAGRVASWGCVLSEPGHIGTGSQPDYGVPLVPCFRGKSQEKDPLATRQAPRTSTHSPGSPLKIASEAF